MAGASRSSLGFAGIVDAAAVPELPVNATGTRNPVHDYDTLKRNCVALYSRLAQTGVLEPHQVPVLSSSGQPGNQDPEVLELG